MSMNNQTFITLSVKQTAIDSILDEQLSRAGKKNWL